MFGLLRSKTLKFYWKTKFHDGKSLFPKIKKSQLVQIPIFRGSKEDQANIGEIVNQIFELRKNDSLADTTDLEKQIDQLVYQLYGLTEEEVAIVEGS